MRVVYYVILQCFSHLHMHSIHLCALDTLHLFALTVSIYLTCLQAAGGAGWQQMGSFGAGKRNWFLFRLAATVAHVWSPDSSISARHLRIEGLFIWNFLFPPARPAVSLDFVRSLLVPLFLAVHRFLCQSFMKLTFPAFRVRPQLFCPWLFRVDVLICEFTP